MNTFFAVATGFGFSAAAFGIPWGLAWLYGKASKSLRRRKPRVRVLIERDRRVNAVGDEVWIASLEREISLS